MERNVVIAGDVSVEVLHVQSSVLGSPGVATDEDDRFDWQRHPAIHVVRQGGGALLLGRLAGALLGQERLVCYQQSIVDELTPADVLHRHLELSERNGRLHIVRFLGNEGPAPLDAFPISLSRDDPDAAVVALNDANNGFRHFEAAWPKAIRDPRKTPVVIVNMKPPLASGALWAQLETRDLSRTVAVVDADDLRALGANISRGLSWERTALDLDEQLSSNAALRPLRQCGHLVVWFGVEGAIHCRSVDGAVRSSLSYTPIAVEGQTSRAFEGRMLGFTSAYCAVLARTALEHGIESLDRAISDALLAARRMLAAGFTVDTGDRDAPYASLFEPQSDDAVVATVDIPAGKREWLILSDAHQGRLQALAESIVIDGGTAKTQHVPLGVFGAFETIDRHEIESFRAVGNLLNDFARKRHVAKPLSIAVFGPPGSGKTFGVNQIALSVGSGRIDTGLQFNVAQWESQRDLVRALHQVRDVVLAGRIPLVFFDEFDATMSGVPLGWLKYFLAPMQNGRFRDEATEHPIGKAIFAFAGGTSHSFANFSGHDGDDFKHAKGPDFVSRLRGYIDITGINPEGTNDALYVIRRATKLRSLIERKARHLIADGKVRIDAGVLTALLTVPAYKHGVRSLEAVLEMSALEGRKLFDQAALPPRRQLALHTDAEEFFGIAMRTGPRR